jgi:DNA polymerase-3 subunit epsilon
VHGISEAFLADKPVFAQIAEAFLSFIGDAQMVIHNASFDMKFINAELEWAGFRPLPDSQALDTLQIARRKFPGSPASLDALCRRFNIDNSMREKHGALLDSEILADVYLELTGGRQKGFGLEAQSDHGSGSGGGSAWRPAPRPKPLPSRLSEKEAAAHAAFVAEMGDGRVWSNYD